MTPARCHRECGISELRPSSSVTPVRASWSGSKLREELIEAYGSICNCCGETEKVFLTIEHKNRDGKLHRETVGNTPTSVYLDLKKRGWPKDDFELLCFNCNRASWVLGVCPHRTRKVEADNE